MTVPFMNHKPDSSLLDGVICGIENYYGSISIGYSYTYELDCASLGIDASTVESRLIQIEWYEWTGNCRDWYISDDGVSFTLVTDCE